MVVCIAGEILCLSDILFVFLLIVVSSSVLLWFLMCDHTHTHTTPMLTMFLSVYLFVCMCVCIPAERHTRCVYQDVVDTSITSPHRRGFQIPLAVSTLVTHSGIKESCPPICTSHLGPGKAPPKIAYLSPSPLQTAVKVTSHLNFLWHSAQCKCTNEVCSFLLLFLFCGSYASGSLLTPE